MRKIRKSCFMWEFIKISLCRIESIKRYVSGTGHDMPDPARSATLYAKSAALYATSIHRLTVLAFFTPERVVHFPHLSLMEIAQWMMGS